MGSYGDPGAVPGLWAGLLDVFQPVSHTGYTHRWQDTGRVLRGLVMASVDSYEEETLARGQGWGTFHGVATVAEALTRGAGASPCPASKELGALIGCDKCHKCDGRSVAVRIAIH
jgi:hypothetical protein